jgi:hypothetical protein
MGKQVGKHWLGGLIILFGTELRLMKTCLYGDMETETKAAKRKARSPQGVTRYNTCSSFSVLLALSVTHFLCGHPVGWMCLTYNHNSTTLSCHGMLQGLVVFTAQ